MCSTDPAAQFAVIYYVSCIAMIQRCGALSLSALQADAMKNTEKAKLRELELGGLVDLTPEHAKFMVIGSTGNHYTVTFTNEKRTCQCPDHRWGPVISFRGFNDSCMRFKPIKQKALLRVQPVCWSMIVRP